MINWSLAVRVGKLLDNKLATENLSITGSIDSVPNVITWGYHTIV